MMVEEELEQQLQGLEKMNLWLMWTVHEIEN